MPLPWDTLPEARFIAQSPTHAVVVVGAGLAGCWVARTLAESGVAVQVVDKHSDAALGASGNPAGIVKPYVTRSPSLAMAFHAEAHRFLLQQLTRWQLAEAADFHPCGVLQLVHRAYPESAHYQCLDAQAASQRAGTSVGSHALEFSNGGWLNPHKLCLALLQHPLITPCFGDEVCSLAHIAEHDDDPRWQLTLRSNRTITASQVVLACGEACHLFEHQQHLPIVPARGQISRFALLPGSAPPASVINGKRYVIPDTHSVLVGATFERHGTHTQITDSDHALNLAGLRQLLPRLQVDTQAVEGYAGIRATTPDRLPVVGPMPDFTSAMELYADLHHGRTQERYPALPVKAGLYVLGGLGSRGIVTAPLSAHLLAGLLLSDTTTRNHWQDWASLINPLRFLIRNLKRDLINTNTRD